MVAGAAEPGAQVEHLLNSQESARAMYNVREGPSVSTLWAGSTGGLPRGLNTPELGCHSYSLEMTRDRSYQDACY